MKVLPSFFVLIIIGNIYGLPRQNHYAGFQLCSDANSLQTLWPDFDNNRIFHQCIGIGHWGTHSCPPPLLFSFSHQVCVWDFQWQTPPPPDQITPFPTTTWPRQTTESTAGSTIDQEVEIPTGPTKPPVVMTTAPTAPTSITDPTTYPTSKTTKDAVKPDLTVRKA
jgi:Chitin binding Peritrophin-A domain